MTTLVTARYACPQCGQQVHKTEMCSMFNVDVGQCSDGALTYSHGAPDHFAYTGCPSCGFVGKTTEWQKSVERADNGYVVGREASVVQAKRPMEKLSAIDRLLARKDLPADERREVLLSYLGAVNHQFGLRAWRSDPHEYEHYMEYTAELVSLLPETGDDLTGRILRAEVQRERGDYVDAIRALTGITPLVTDAYMHKVVREIREHAERGERTVFIIRPDPTKEESEEEVFQERWPEIFRFVVERDTIRLTDVMKRFSLSHSDARRYMKDMREYPMFLPTRTRGVYRVIEPDVHNIDPERVFLWYTVRVTPHLRRHRVHIEGEPVYTELHRALDITWTVQSEKDLERAAKWHGSLEHSLTTTLPVCLNRARRTMTLTVPFKREYIRPTEPVWE